MNLMITPILIISHFSEVVSPSSWWRIMTKSSKILANLTSFKLPLQFRVFLAERWRLETAETQQAHSQLYFPPKIIKIRSLFLENESLEVAWVVPKKRPKKLTRISCMYVCMYVVHYNVIHTHIHARYTREHFWKLFRNHLCNFKWLVLQE